MNEWIFLFLIVSCGTGFALIGVNVRGIALRIRRAWLLRFPKWRAVGEPTLMTYGEAERLLTQPAPANRRWQIAARLEDGNRRPGYVWLELAERVLL